ncbi:MAG: DMT family transporter [Anaerosomatales bacterium]|nr:DMT family transporter [Anaerosomatales bacterium]MDT8434078.1 DMT family transporter [Anaerosomatales bacterium]
MKRRTALAAVAVSAACFGTLAIFTSLAYERGAQPLQLLSWRFGIAAVLLGTYLALKKPSALRVSGGDLARYAVLSVAGYGAASLCFFFALNYAEASVVAVLLYTYPAMIAVVDSVLRPGPVDPGRAFAVLLAFAGCVLVVNPFSASGGTHPLGVVLGLGAAAGYASFTLLSHRWMPGRSRSVLMTYTFAATAVLVTGAALASGSRLAPVGWDWQLWALLGAIVLLPTFAAVILYLRALSRIGAAQASLLSTLEPIFTIALAALLLGDRLTPLQLGGAALVLVAVVISELRARGAEEQPVVI